MARSKSNDTPTFADFWAQYPIHKDRKRAEQAWQRLTAGDRRAALAALPAYVADCQQNGIQYKYAQGWLNGRRWEDEVAEPQAQQVSCSSTSEAAARPLVACYHRDARKPSAKFQRSMLGQMNVRGKADGLTVPEIIVQEPTGQSGTERELSGQESSPTTPYGMETW